MLSELCLQGLELGSRFSAPKTVVLDPVNAAGPDMLEEASEKFVSIELYFAAPTVFAIAVEEHNPGVREGIQLVLREGPGVERFREIAQHRLGLMREFDEDRPRGERS